MNNLKKHGLTVNNILKTPDKVLRELIKIVNYHDKKV